MKKQKINIVVGPTASGKSSLAFQMAKELSGQIVNADAFQVYSGLRVLTARPTIQDENEVPHHLYGYADNDFQENVQGWLNKACEILPSLSNPIVVGGTGMYINALINGINEMPDIPDEIRQSVRQMDIKEVRSLLKGQSVFPDPQRQRRALEVFLATGQTIEYFQKQPPKKMIDADFYVILVQPPRQIVYDKIAKRLDVMMEQGVIKEVENLLKSNACGGVLKAIGVKEIAQFLNKELTLEQTKEQILLSTRHYAKRQMTWFRHQITPDLLMSGKA